MKFIFEDPVEQPSMPQQQGMIQQPQQMMPQQQPVQQGKYIFEDPEEPYFNPEMPKDESWSQYLTRLPIGAASTAAKSVGKTYDFLTNLEEGISTRLLPQEEREAFTKERAKMPHSALSEKGIEEGISKLFPKKYRDPKDTLIEKGLHMVAGEAPWIALALGTGGGALAGKEALKMAGKRAVGSLAGSEGAKAAGLNEFWQGVGGLVGSFGPDILKLTTHQFSKELQPQLYNEAKRLAGSNIEDATSLSKDLLKLDHIISGPNSGLKTSASIDVQKQLENVRDLISNGKISLQDAVDRRKSLNSIINVTHGDTEIGYYTEMKKLLDKNILDKAKEKLPSWGKAFDEAQDLTKVIGSIDKAESVFTKAANGLIGIAPPLKAIKPATFLVSGLIPTEFSKYLIASPKTAGKYLGQIAQNSLLGDVSALRRSLLNMDKLMKHEDKKMKRKR